MNELYLLTDEQLVVLYISGTDEAFDALLARHKDRLFSYIYYQVKNEDLANDIFQDTFTKAIVHLRNKRYAENGKFYSWLSCIAHNLIIDLFRQEKNENVVSNDETEVDLFNNIKLSDDTIETKLVNEQVLRDVRRLVELLPEEQREVVMMRYYYGMSFQEIADQTGVSINTALGRVRYALINMRKLIREHNVILS